MLYSEPDIFVILDKCIGRLRTCLQRKLVLRHFRMMAQIYNNPRAQAMLGEFDTALDDAVLDSNTAHIEQMTPLMSDPAKMKQFGHII